MTEASENTVPTFWKEPSGARVPRIALMGEFSAGKSTLANMMIGSNPLPVQVVATQLPPVWITYGDAPSVIVDLEGNQTVCDLASLQGIVPEEVAFIRIFAQEEILKKCDIIDMPGISDPNMDCAVWQRIMPFADGVLWCSPATQAWRQSEAAVWETIDEKIQKASMLVLTRGDMLLTEKDKYKVLKRVRAEAGDLFSDVLMVSLALARDAGEDEEQWARSGADAFVAKYLSLVETLASNLEDRSAPTLTPFAAEVSSVPERTTETLDEPAQVERSAVSPRRPVLRRKPVADVQTAVPAEENAASYLPKFS